MLTLGGSFEVRCRQQHPRIFPATLRHYRVRSSTLDSQTEAALGNNKKEGIDAGKRILPGDPG